MSWASSVGHSADIIASDVAQNEALTECLVDGGDRALHDDLDLFAGDHLVGTLDFAHGLRARFGERSDAVQGIAVRLRRGAEVLPEVFREMDSAGLAVANVQLHAPSLDDVFLAKTGRSLDVDGGGASMAGAGVPAAPGEAAPR